MAKEYFSHDVDALADIKIVKMMQDYGYIGFGWYWAIVAEIYRNGGRYNFEDLNILAKAVDIKEEKLKAFIDKCISKFTHNGRGLFLKDDKGFWSASLQKRIALREKRAAARKSDISERKDIEGIEFVNLTEDEYNKLLDKYGEKLLMKAIKILDNWLALKGKNAKGYLGKDNYGHFRADGWVITKAKESLGLNKKPNWGI